MQREIEAKFLLPHLASLRERLLACGGRLLSDRVLERNWRFDTKTGDLQSQRKILRLREDARTEVTFKRGLESVDERVEITLVVNDAKKARDLLFALGYQVVTIYEKFRETFALHPVEVMLDELPYGYFVEIEGPSREEIRGAALQLQLNWEARLRSNYTQLFQHLQSTLNLPFNDATFENLAPYQPIDSKVLGWEMATLPD
jgi:adenylate cyclase class 2